MEGKAVVARNAFKGGLRELERAFLREVAEELRDAQDVVSEVREWTR